MSVVDSKSGLAYRDLRGSIETSEAAVNLRHVLSLSVGMREQTSSYVIGLFEQTFQRKDQQC